MLSSHSYTTIDRWTPENFQPEDFCLEAYATNSLLALKDNLKQLAPQTINTKILPKIINKEIKCIKSLIPRQIEGVKSQTTLKMQTILPNINKSQLSEKKSLNLNRNFSKPTLKVKFLDISPFSHNGIRLKKEKKPKKNKSLSSSFFKLK